MKVGMKESEKENMPPAQLWVGPHETLVANVHDLMRRRWCQCGGCKVCRTCRCINEHHYHQALWIEPQGSYTREHLELLFAATKFARGSHEDMVFVLSKADAMPPACYNSLLKVIEEPPAGCYFIFLARCVESIALTIRSRCILVEHRACRGTPSRHPLLMFFMHTDYEDPQNFLSVLERANPGEHESVELIDVIFVYWAAKYQEAIMRSQKDEAELARSAMSVARAALSDPPPAGSVQLFWKNFFAATRLS